MRYNKFKFKRNHSNKIYRMNKFKQNVYANDIDKFELHFNRWFIESMNYQMQDI